MHRRTVGHRPELEHLRRELVAHDEVAARVEADRCTHLACDRDELVGVVQRVEVGAADPAGLDRHQHVARTEYGVGNLLDHEDTTTGDGSTHGARLTGAAAEPTGREAQRERPINMEPNCEVAGLDR